MIETYFSSHNHTHYSNIRLLDAVIKPKALIDKAIELGLSGVAITDHECLGAHIQVNQYAKEIREKYPDFTIALGNEIYLTDTRDSGQRYYHFILIAKDLIGHKALRELSSTAWLGMYVDRGMERVPLLKTELAAIMQKYRGHVLATTACIGGELGQTFLARREARTKEEEARFYEQQLRYIKFCQDVFGDDFYIECAPSTNPDQIYVNQCLYKIAQYFKIPMTVATDSHYLTKDDRLVHKAYLNSKNGEREVDSFYEFTYLITPKECRELLKHSFNSEKIVDELFFNTEKMKQSIQFYDLGHQQIIPKIEVTNYPIEESDEWNEGDFPTVSKLLKSSDIQERYWINEVIKGLKEKGFIDNLEYKKRVETEADVIKYIGEQLNDNLFAYFNTFKHYIDLFWKCGSIVGPGRGSSTGFLTNYLLGITQLDPIRWGLQYWRFLNKDRQELPDIDIDLAPSKRSSIFKAIRDERGPLGLIQVATFGTEGTKSAILAACRGYRSDEYTAGIDVDIAQYLSSLIPQERGFLWPIADVVHGNQEKGRRPVQPFLDEIQKYPGLLNIIENIEGLINKRSSHASGVIFYNGDPYDTNAIMRTPSGDLVTCWDLHDSEFAGDTKYDLLLTEACDKIVEVYQLLLEDEQIPDMSLRDFYNDYLHPEVIDTTKPEIWRHLQNGDILDVFQFSTGVGLQTAKRVKPENIYEMTAANALMRLMSEEGVESQQDRYCRIQKHGIELFDGELKANNLSEEQRQILHEVCDKYYGCCLTQEDMMVLLMRLAGFSLAEANNARKIVAKKKMDQIPVLRDQFFERFADQKVGQYLWSLVVRPQLGYSFSVNHALPYSFVGAQEILLATTFNPIYWDTACLVVNSGSLESVEDAATDYGKVAKAIGNVQKAGIKVSLIDINHSKYGFYPDTVNNQILFGLKGLLNVGDDIVKEIIEKRPYESIKDFMIKVNPGKQAMVSLIKAGAFDNMMDRKIAMGWYLWETCDKKKNLTLQNIPTLIKYNLLAEDTDALRHARRIYEFNRYLKAICKKDSVYYQLDERAINFLLDVELDAMINGGDKLGIKAWDSVYQKTMDVYRNWIKANKENILNELNAIIFKEAWDKYAQGSYSSWEMEVMCFYYHDHELKDIDGQKYGIVNFFELPAEPEVERTFKKGERSIPLYKLTKICGTCIAKNKIRSTISLLTVNGVVEVKFNKEYFSLFDRQISAMGDDGHKHVVESSWFKRGTMLIVTGMRRGDNFVAKRYKSTPGHTLFKISSISSSGELELAGERAVA